VTSGVQPLEAAIVALTTALRSTGVPFMLIGGIAVITRGVARVTTDVDATIRAEGLLVEALVATLAQHGIVGRIEDVVDFARSHHELEALARAEPIVLAHASIPVAHPEDLVIYKAVAWRDRDRADVERLLVQHADRIDLTHVRRIVREFADVLGAPERIAELEAVIRRATRTA